VSKHIDCPLLHFARVRCLAASAVTPRGYENKWLPLHILMSSRTISHHLHIILLAPEERDRKESEKI
jgi:hypothetical protein